MTAIYRFRNNNDVLLAKGLSAEQVYYIQDNCQLCYTHLDCYKRRGILNQELQSIFLGIRRHFDWNWDKFQVDYSTIHSGKGQCGQSGPPILRKGCWCAIREQRWHHFYLNDIWAGVYQILVLQGQYQIFCQPTPKKRNIYII